MFATVYFCSFNAHLISDAHEKAVDALVSAADVPVSYTHLTLPTIYSV